MTKTALNGQKPPESRIEMSVIVEAAGPGAPWLIGKLLDEVRIGGSYLKDPEVQKRLVGQDSNLEIEQAISCGYGKLGFTVKAPWGRDPQAAVEYTKEVIEWLEVGHMLVPDVSIRLDGMSPLITNMHTLIRKNEGAWTKLAKDVSSAAKAPWDILMSYGGPRRIDREAAMKTLHEGLGLSSTGTSAGNLILAIERGDMDEGDPVWSGSVRKGLALNIERLRLDHTDPLDTDTVRVSVTAPFESDWAIGWSHAYKTWIRWENLA